MARILPCDPFRSWLEGFLPGLVQGAVLAPVPVPDRTDPRIVHLDGLNLSRARCLRALAAALGPGDPRCLTLERDAPQPCGGGPAPRAVRPLRGRALAGQLRGAAVLTGVAPSKRPGGSGPF